MGIRATYSEAAFTGDVIAFARLHRWRVAHFRPARTSAGWRTAVSGDGAGWPDLVLVRGQVLIVAELKVGKGRLTPEQRLWIAALEAAGVPAYCWWPKNWRDIEEALGGAGGLFV